MLASLAKEVDDFILAREKKQNAGKPISDTAPSAGRYLAQARAALEQWAAEEHAGQLGACSDLREAYFKLFLEARARSRNARVMSELWIESEEAAFLFLELSKIPTRFLTPERIQELASGEHPATGEAPMRHKGH